MSIKQGLNRVYYQYVIDVQKNLMSAPIYFGNCKLNNPLASTSSINKMKNFATTLATQLGTLMDSKKTFMLQTDITVYKSWTGDFVIVG